MQLQACKSTLKIGNTVGMNATLELLIAYCTGDGQKTNFY